MIRGLHRTSGPALVATAALLLVGCNPLDGGSDGGARDHAGGASTAGSESAISTLDGRTWRFDRVAGEAVPDGVEVTLQFDPGTGRVSGLAACNRYTADLALDDAILEVGVLASTKRACVPPQMETEAAFFDALRSASTLTIDDRGRLVLSHPGGRPSIARPWSATDAIDPED